MGPLVRYNESWPGYFWSAYSRNADIGTLGIFQRHIGDPSFGGNWSGWWILWRANRRNSFVYHKCLSGVAWYSLDASACLLHSPQCVYRLAGCGSNKLGLGSTCFACTDALGA